MNADPTSPNHDGHQTGPGRAARRAWVGGILLLALGARVFYADGLPLNGDEAQHLRAAREISLHPDSFNLPLDSPLTGHPLGVLYLTALADWAGGGNVLVIRLAFVGLSMFGLVGVYVLGSSLFGFRVGIVGLALAAVDRSLIALAPVFLESPSVISLAPWTMLLMRRCVARGLARDWLLAGLLFGLGYWLSTVFVAMLLPFGLYILATRRLPQVLKSPWTYAGLAVTLGMILPTVLGDLSSGWMSQQRNLEKAGSIGLSPRMALLYVGDLLICLKAPTWIVQNVGGKMYMPIYVPCDWVTGLAYMALTSVSLRYWRDERVGLLLLVILGFLIPVTLIDAREAWNEFTWASSTVFSAIVLSAFVLDRKWAHKGGRIVVPAVLAYCSGALALFLAGPKWGYFSPEWERRYVGQVLVIELQSGREETPIPYARAAAEIRELTREALSRQPESAVAWYFQGHYAESATARRKALAQALDLAPGDPLLVIAQANALAKAGDLAGAKRLLERLLAQHGESVHVHAALAEVEYELGNYARAAAHVRRRLAVHALDLEPYAFLFDIYDAMGEKAKAEASLKDYVRKHPEGTAAAYRQLAGQFQRRAARSHEAIRSGRRGTSLHFDGTGPADNDPHPSAARGGKEIRDYGLAIRLATRACEVTGWKDPECLEALAAVYRGLARSLAAGGDFERAIEAYHKALQTDRGDVASLFDLAFLLCACPDKKLRNPAEAVRLAEQGCELTEHSDPAGLMILAAAHAEAGQFEMAINQIHKALRLVQATGDAGLIAELRYRLKRYEDGIAELKMP